MQVELDNIYNCDCLDGLRSMEANSVDLIVTSPPYDNLRTYGSIEDEWNFDKFKPIAEELFRVTKNGGVVVWIVGDSTVDGGESGISFRQARFFQHIGFKLHDTMIYEKNSSSFPASAKSKRYTQIFEYMFVFSKGTIRKDITLIADKKNKWSGWVNWGQMSQYNADGKETKENKKAIKPVPEYSIRTNIWKYSTAFNDKTSHPAVFPEKLAEDHIISWSNVGDVVLDPFMGSGTTAKMAKINGRHFIGFEQNKDYYEESLKRIEKYNLSEIAQEEIEIEDENYIIISDDTEKEVQKKMALWNELTKELEERFNTQAYNTLKNLKVELSFKSKSNDKRIKETLKTDIMEENLKAELNEAEKEERNYDLLTGQDYQQKSQNHSFDIENELTKLCIEIITRGLNGFISRTIEPIIKDGVFDILNKDRTDSNSRTNGSPLTSEEAHILNICRETPLVQNIIDANEKDLFKKELYNGHAEHWLEEYKKDPKYIVPSDDCARKYLQEETEKNPTHKFEGELTHPCFDNKMNQMFENPNKNPYVVETPKEEQLSLDELEKLLTIDDTVTPTQKKRGRPKGSKNKPKEEAKIEQVDIESTETEKTV